jgi:hypothetical protein
LCVVTEMQEGMQSEAAMIRVRLEYDAYNRVFKLIDREFGSVLQDGAVYELKLPLMLEEPDGEENLIELELGPLAHA